MTNKIVASYEWRDLYIIFPRKINEHWRCFETVEQRRVLKEDTNDATSMTLIYSWEYRIKEENKIPGWDRPFDSNLGDR